MTQPFLSVSTTTEKRTDAERIARALIEGRLAACVQISGPVQSIYRWQGVVESAPEYVCTIKTRGTLIEHVIAEIARLHPYDEPEIVAVPIVTGSSGYLRWLDEQLERRTGDNTTE